MASKEARVACWGTEKFAVAGAGLLNAFDVGGQLVGGFYQPVYIGILLRGDKKGAVVRLHILRQHG